MDRIKEMLLSNPQSIENILNKLNFYKVRKYRDEIICGNSENGKGNSIHIKIDETLISSDFKYGINSSFISFLMKKRDLEFKDIIKIIKDELGVESFSFSNKNNGVFGGVYKKIKKNESSNKYNILDELILKPYKNKFNTRFLEDGINLETQRKFNIGYDVENQAIIVPWWDYEGNLIGIMLRFNNDNDDFIRWMPIIPFSKKNTLYGYSNNYKYLECCDTVYILESEKGVMQLDSMGINTGVSLGCSSISQEQIKKIISLQPKRIVYCFDEGLPEDLIIKYVKITKRLVKYNHIQVGYIYDDNNDILPKNSKYSPTDLGKEVFLQLVKEKIKEVIL